METLITILRGYKTIMNQAANMRKARRSSKVYLKRKTSKSKQVE